MLWFYLDGAEKHTSLWIFQSLTDLCFRMTFFIWSENLVLWFFWRLTFCQMPDWLKIAVEFSSSLNRIWIIEMQAALRWLTNLPRKMAEAIQSYLLLFRHQMGRAVFMTRILLWEDGVRSPHRYGLILSYLTNLAGLSLHGTAIRMYWIAMCWMICLQLTRNAMPLLLIWIPRFISILEVPFTEETTKRFWNWIAPPMPMISTQLFCTWDLSKHMKHMQIVQQWWLLHAHLPIMKFIAVQFRLQCDYLLPVCVLVTMLESILKRDGNKLQRLLGYCLHRLLMFHSVHSGRQNESAGSLILQKWKGWFVMMPIDQTARFRV